MVDYNKRIEYLRNSLLKEELHGIIISQPENRRYISGFTGSSGICIISDKEAILATDSRYTEQATKQCPELSVIQTTGTFDKWLPELLTNLPKGSNLGIESEHVTYGTFNRFKTVSDELGITLKPMNGLLEQQRNIKDEDEMVAKAHSLIGEHPDVFSTPVDIAVNKDGERVEIDVRDLAKDDEIFDIGTKTLEHYSRIVSSAGTVFMSGPAGFFEKENFQFGTKSMLEAISQSTATSIISGGHLTSALRQYNLTEKVNHISTAGGALVRYLTGQKLPMIKCLEDAAEKHTID